MAEAKSGGWLSKIFMGAVKLATIGVASAVAWQLFLDPIFFPIFHDTSNATAQAFVHLINHTFSWIPDLIGLTGDGGLLHTDFAQNILKPHYDATAAISGDMIKQSVASTGQGISLDDLGL